MRDDSTCPRLQIRRLEPGKMGQASATHVDPEQGTMLQMAEAVPGLPGLFPFRAEWLFDWHLVHPACWSQTPSLSLNKIPSEFRVNGKSDVVGEIRGPRIPNSSFSCPVERHLFVCLSFEPSDEILRFAGPRRGGLVRHRQRANHANMRSTSRPSCAELVGIVPGLSTNIFRRAIVSRPISKTRRAIPPISSAYVQTKN